MATAKSKIDLIIEAKSREAIKHLNKTEKEIDDLSKSSQKVNNSFSGLGRTIGAVFGAIAVQQVVGFAMETAKLASTSEDLRRSLNNLAQKEGLNTVQLMKDLRAATGNAVSDIDLMKSATQGKFLGVDLKNMPILFQFASQRARDTGQNIDYLVESIVTGIGRKSPLILDNLGIQMRDLDAEVEKIARSTGKWTGKVDENLRSLYLQDAAVTVAKRAISESGEQSETAATKFERFAASIENLKVTIGELVSGPLADFAEVLDIVLKRLTGTLDGSDRIRILKGEISALVAEIKNLESGGLPSGGGLLSINDPEFFRERLKKAQAELASLLVTDSGLLSRTGTAFQTPKPSPGGGGGTGEADPIQKLKNALGEVDEAAMRNSESFNMMFDTVDENAPGFEEALRRGTMELQEQQRIALEVGSIIESSFQALTQSLIDGATKGSEAWGDFFDTLKKQITAFLVSEAVKGLLGMFIGAIIPGGSALFGPSIFSKVFSRGGSAPSINSGLAAAPVSTIGIPAIATPSMPTRGGMGGGSIINNIVNNRGGNGQIVEVMVRNVPIPQADVRAWLRDANRQIIIPDTDTVNQFNRTKKSEFD